VRHEIVIDTSARTCQVVTGAARRTFYSTPQAVGLALLSGGGIDMEEEGASGLGVNITWTDLLASNGVAVGTRGRQVVTLGVIPAKERTVDYLTSDGRRPLTRVFPATLLGMLMEGGRFVRGTVHLADTSRQATFAVLSQTPVLMGFPYGNIYQDSGRICWGTVRTDSIHTLADFEALFFGSGFNTDLFSTASGLRSLGQQVEGGILPIPPATQFHQTFSRVVEYLAEEIDPEMQAWANGDYCLAASPHGWACTRPRWHTTEHVACLMSGKVLERWVNLEGVAEELMVREGL
jgi:hypothetical protein